MKRLILHPDDRSTDFLKPIYSQLKNTTAITGGIRHQTEIHKLIQSHDQVIMLGHGMPEGLLSVGQFGLARLLIDHRCAKLLREKDFNIFIWCYASDFVMHHKLKGYASGMFISEELEAIYHNVEGTEDQVNISNSVFSAALGEALMLNLSKKETYEYVNSFYEPLTTDNPIAHYNIERIGWC